MLKGSCLCKAVTFGIEGLVRGVGSCHCSKCRKVSGTGGNAVFIVGAGRFRWLSGEDNTFEFKMADGWGCMRCKTCGSPLPESHDGERVWVPAGLMDDPLDTDLKQHIFCASKADWDRDAADASFHDEAATSPQA